MSPTSHRLELLASLHSRPVLEIQEFYLERAAIREHDGRFTRELAEQHALEDVERWLEWERLCSKR